MQVKFSDFKQAAIAFEELHKVHTVKFAYRSQIPHYEQNIELKRTRPIELKGGNHALDKNRNRTLNQHRSWSPENKQLKNSVDTIYEGEHGDNLQKIIKTRANPSLANRSWNQVILEEIGDESESWETTSTSSNEMFEMQTKNKEIQ